MFNLGGDQSKTQTSGFGYNIGEQFSEGGSYFDPQQQQNQQRLINSYFGMYPNMGQYGIQQGTQMGLNQLNQYAARQMVPGNRFQNRGVSGLNQLETFSQFNNPYLQQNIGNLGQNLGRQFREQVLPGIGSNAQLAGQRGSSRQGIAEGLAADAMLQQFQQGATALQSDAYAQQIGAAGQLAGIGTQGALGYAGQELAGREALANFIPQVWDARMQGQMMPFMIGSELIGAPTALNYNRSYGYDLGYEENRSKSKSQGLDIGIG